VWWLALGDGDAAEHSDDECDRPGGMVTQVPAWAADCDWARESVAA